MKERPILMTGPLVRAVLDGKKTQTRRLVKPQPVALGDGRWRHSSGVKSFIGSEDGLLDHWRVLPDVPGACPFGVPGDRLWVRETWAPHGLRQPGPVMYAADGAIGAWLDDGGGGRFWSHHGWVSGHAAPEKVGRWYGKPNRWRPSIHMPRWASRLSLVIASVRVERLQNITEEDARAEGFEPEPPGTAFDLTARDLFRHTWLDLYGAESWNANPWVWVLGFTRAA